MPSFDNEYMITEIRWDVVALIIKKFRIRHPIDTADKTDLEILKQHSITYILHEIIRFKEKVKEKQNE